MANLIELESYENPDSLITIKRSSIEEIIAVGEARTDLRFASGRSLAVRGDFTSVMDRVGSFLELPGEREGHPHLINPEMVEQVEQTSAGWCRLSMASGRSYYVQGDRYDISLKVETAGIARYDAEAEADGNSDQVITADFVGHRTVAAS